MKGSEKVVPLVDIQALKWDEKLAERDYLLVANLAFSLVKKKAVSMAAS